MSDEHYESALKLLAEYNMSRDAEKLNDAIHHLDLIGYHENPVSECAHCGAEIEGMGALFITPEGHFCSEYCMVGGAPIKQEIENPPT